jgi:hypothetical protein
MMATRLQRLQPLSREKISEVVLRYYEVVLRYYRDAIYYRRMNDQIIKTAFQSCGIFRPFFVRRLRDRLAVG